MNQFKDLNLKIDITNKKKRVESTDSLFFSYDINAIRVIADITKNSEVLPDDTKVFLVVQSAHSMNYEATDSIKIKLDTNITEGKATFELPNEILSYRGFIRLDFYVDFETGSNDSGQAYVFELRKSQIDQAFEQVEFVYISEFELSKKRVLEAEKQALETIEGVGNQLDATIEETRQAIVKRPSELDADITQAKSDILDKVATVDVSKTQAQTTISEHVASVEQAKTTAETSMSDSVQNVSDKQAEALSSIDTSVSDVQSKQAQTTETFTQAVQDVQQAKSDAQSVIASQTDLSTDVQQAKASMTDSVQSVKDVATSEIETIKAETINVQNVADYETQQIEAIRPQLESDIQFVKENAESIKAKGFLETPKIAWANSRDMLTDFTDVYPRKNLALNQKEVLKFYTLNSASFPITTQQFVTEKGVYTRTKRTNINSYATTISIVSFYTMDFNFLKGKKIAISCLARSSESLSFSIYNQLIVNGQVVNMPRHGGSTNLTNNWSTISAIFEVPENLGNITQIRFNPSSSYNVKDIANFWLDIGFYKIEIIEDNNSVATIYVSPSVENYENSLMKYYATSNINTNDPTKFTQGRYTDEYIDYKLQQLSNTTFATGGTV